MSNQTNRVPSIAIVGGGIAGLTAAVSAAQQGARVTLFEKASHLGGRARTQQRDEIAFNLGPHALYAGRDGQHETLAQLGIKVQGSEPPVNSTLGVWQNQIDIMPVSAPGMLRNKQLSLSDKAAYGKLMLAIMRANPSDATHLSWSQWLTQQTSNPRVAAIAHSLGRLSTYANAPEVTSAALYLRQLQQVTNGKVLYLDHGWQTIVDSLASAAQEAGAFLRIGCGIETIVPSHSAVTIITKAGERQSFDAVIMAGSPATVASLLSNEAELNMWAASAIPVKAASLDIALSHLPHPDRLIALGIEQPLYYSVHSHVARLAPAGQHVIHLAKYLPLDEQAPEESKAELYALLDLLQPGWHQYLITERFLPNLIVANRLPLAASKEAAPSIACTNQPRIFLAGDWVMADRWLADASIRSGFSAAQAAIGVTPQVAEMVTV